MESLSTIKLGLAKKLQDKSYRHRFFRRRTQVEIAVQIKKLREKRGMIQSELAKLMGTGQSAVARIEDSGYSGWTFKTLLSATEVLDARLIISFQPMEDVIAEYEKREKEVLRRK